MPTRRLRQMAAELNGLAEILDKLAKSGLSPESIERVKDEAAQFNEIAHWSELARQLYAMRRLRDKVFDAPNLFGEPSWDMLLDLFVAEIAEKSVAVTSLCLAAAIPSTTALRWISVLENENLVYREKDGSDRRKHYVRLSDEGLRKMVDIMRQSTLTTIARKHQPSLAPIQ